MVVSEYLADLSLAVYSAITYIIVEIVIHFEVISGVIFEIVSEISASTLSIIANALFIGTSIHSPRTEDLFVIFDIIYIDGLIFRSEKNFLRSQTLIKRLMFILYLFKLSYTCSVLKLLL